jgi:hypothetical protein
MTRPLSNRSRTYLEHIANVPEGYWGIVPYSTADLLRRLSLITQVEERYGIPVYVITDAGRKVLAQSVETPVPVLISDDQAQRMIALEGYLNRRGQRALAAWRQSKTGI